MEKFILRYEVNSRIQRGEEVTIIRTDQYGALVENKYGLRIWVGVDELDVKLDKPLSEDN